MAAHAPWGSGQDYIPKHNLSSVSQIDTDDAYVHVFRNL